ncbi:copper homeostasis protein CutC [Larkinella punicea]|uniref:PF03932 family protein CutC n=1 Tax=Larkinella punicea TaxID=2315727 RepID=A0A368JNE5_9BACT|nr:copper homeostasis protein CutC [Larkinella punicea]RCR68103.1 copper homeostasis protein CutC [Larkinella punicea]
MNIEICAFSLESCLIAQANGATRIELCGGAGEGGTTPSYGLIELARQQVTIALYVMIRPRGGDFLYNATELAVMRRDIEAAKQAGADGVVLGLLKADGTIDEEKTAELIRLAHPLAVTFHRAFDLTLDPAEALEAVIRTGAKRILTSGQQASAEAGIPLLRQLVQQADDRIEIMAGAGVTATNAAHLAATGVHALHLTGKQVMDSGMEYRKPGVPMASVALGEYEWLSTSREVVRAVVEATKTISRS